MVAMEVVEVEGLPEVAEVSLFFDGISPHWLNEKSVTNRRCYRNRI